MPGVGIKNERRIRDVLLKDKGVDARYHDVILPIHDEYRLLDFLELTISIRFGDHAPASNRCCLGTHGRHRRLHILVSARVTTLPKGASCCLACLARREEKVEKILDDRRLVGCVLCDLRPQGVHTFSALWSRASEDHTPDQTGIFEDNLLGDEPSQRKPEQVDPL